MYPSVPSPSKLLTNPASKTAVEQLDKYPEEPRPSTVDASTGPESTTEEMYPSVPSPSKLLTNPDSKTAVEQLDKYPEVPNPSTVDVIIGTQSITEDI